MPSIGTPALWAGFTALVIVLLALDLGVLHRTPRAMRMRDAALSSIAWLLLAALFAVGMHARFGAGPALEFVTGYLIEEALSIDNLFVFLVIFQFFKVPSVQQHRVLFWGIFGALVMRAVFIALGAAIVSRFHWVFYILGAFLVYTGIKLLLQKGEESHPEDSAAVRLFQRLVPTTKEMRGS
ncbi:MAG TPA: hypothetical protein VFH51_20575, partial [Myxococcota bacterium]|nr:hypothetical protein [Myxococcota bacterium]